MSENTSNLVIITGSVREGRFGPVVTDWVAARAREHGGFDVAVVDLADVDIPLALPDASPKAPGYPRPDGMRAVTAQLDEADAFVVVTPEYNHSYPASLKALIDWHFTQWAAKPVAFVSYGGAAGGRHAVLHLENVFTEVARRDHPRRARVPELLPRVGGRLPARRGCARLRQDPPGAAVLVGGRAPDRTSGGALPGLSGRAASWTGERPTKLAPDGLLLAVDSVQIPVPDLDAALAFYRDRLGHELLWRTATAAAVRLRATGRSWCSSSSGQRRRSTSSSRRWTRRSPRWSPRAGPSSSRRSTSPSVGSLAWPTRSARC